MFGARDSRASRRDPRRPARRRHGTVPRTETRPRHHKHTRHERRDAAPTAQRLGWTKASDGKGGDCRPAAARPKFNLEKLVGRGSYGQVCGRRKLGTGSRSQ